MRRGIVVTVLLAGMLTLVVPGSAAADVITIPDSTVTLPAASDTKVVFPFTVAAGVAATSLVPHLVRVTLAGRPLDLAGLEALTVTIDPTVPAVVVAANVDQLVRAGDYTVTFAVTSGQQTELHDLTLTRAPAAVTAPTTVDIERTILFGTLCLGLCSDTEPTLRLIAGADTRVTQLAAYPLDTGAVDVTIAGHDGSPAAVVPTLTSGGSLPLPYTVNGSSDVGAVTRNIRITSPQLGQPIDVQFQITTKRTAWLIVIIAALGLLLGALIRRVLIPLRNRSLEVRRAAAAVVQLENLQDSSEDTPFRTALDGPLATLRAITLSRTITSPANATKVIDTALKDAETAVNTLNDSLTRLHLTFDPLYKALRVPRRLPAPLAGLLTTALADAVATENRLVAMDAEGATTNLDKLQSADQPSIVQEARVAVLDTSRQAALLAAALQNSAESLFGSVRDRAAELAGVVAPADDSTLADALAKAALLEANVDAIVGELTAALQTAVAQAPTAQQPAARAAAAAIVAALGTGHPLGAAAACMPPLLEQLVDDNPALGPRRADAALVQAAIPAPSAELEPLGVEHASALRMAALRRFAVAGVTIGFSDFVQFVLLWTILSILAYTVFVPDWTGTATQMLAVFSWAFALNVGVDAVRANLAPVPVAPVPVAPAKPAA